MRTSRAWRAVVGGVGVLLLLAGGCTGGSETEALVPEAADPQPAPSVPPGARVGIVLPPSSEVDPGVIRAIEAQLAVLAAGVGDDVQRLQGYPAADRRFAADLAGWLAEERADLVCVMGERAESVVVPLAALYRDVRFCAVPARSTGGLGRGEGDADADDLVPDADGVVRVEVRAEELGYLVGVAARAQAGDGAVGLVLEGDALPDAAFREGLLAGLAGGEVVETETASAETSVADRTEALVAAEVAVIVLDAAAGAADAVAVVGDRAAVFAPAVLVGGRDDRAVALSWSVRWDVVLQGPLTSLVDGEPPGARFSVGLREGAFEVTVGPAAIAATAAVVTTTLDGLVAGDIDPRVPVLPPS